METWSRVQWEPNLELYTVATLQAMSDKEVITEGKKGDDNAIQQWKL